MQVAAFVINQKTNAQGRAVRREAYRRSLSVGRGCRLPPHLPHLALRAKYGTSLSAGQNDTPTQRYVSIGLALLLRCTGRFLVPLPDIADFTR
jgi:hypothetical protein